MNDVSSEIVRGRVKLHLLRSHGSDKEHRCEKVQPRWHEEAPEPREERVRGKISTRWSLTRFVRFVGIHFQLFIVFHRGVSASRSFA